MTCHYSTRNFFRQMPNSYLARYFAARVALQGFDSKAVKETKVDAVGDRSASESSPWRWRRANGSTGHRALIGPFKFGAAKEPLKFRWRVVAGGHRVHRT